jgi:uncharacterized cupredoxin-like copper-binding protein
VYFRVDNAGPEDAHEFVVIKTDSAQTSCPWRRKVGTRSTSSADRLFAPGDRAAIAFDLEPGTYALICNVAEVEDGTLESHYQLGMHTDFVVD